MKNFWKKNKEIVTKILIALGIVLALVILFFVSENIGDRSMDKKEVIQSIFLEEGQVLDAEKMKPVTEITYDEFKDILSKKGKTTTVVLLGTDDCYYCQQQKPVLESLMYEYNLDIKYLNVSTGDENGNNAKITQKQYQEIVDLHKDLTNEDGTPFGTPTFISIRNKKVRKVSQGGQTRTQLLKTFADMGIITTE